LSDLGEICYKSLHTMLLATVSFPRKSAKERSYFSYRSRRNYKSTCSTKPYGVMRVRTALVNYVHYIAQLHILNPVAT